ncbi:MAG: hypothetical protein M3R43_05895 [Acidobacteriota bacterium]|nr:hypothetical protein [Acidobacteriota bacterium]
MPGSIASHPGWPVAKPEDVKSIEAITAAVYDVISRPAGKPRDWDRFRSLFVPDARLVPVRVPRPSTDPAASPPHNDIAPYTVEDYIARSSPTMLTQGFAERGIANRVEAFGNIAHVWSTYESRHSFTDPQPFARGINSISLIKDGNRYWVVQILWDSERPGSAIPEKYLAK